MTSARRITHTIALALLFLPWHVGAQPQPQQAARAILDAAGVKGGLVVHLGCGDGKLTAALRANDSYVVYGLDANAANVQKAREHIRSLGLYGKVSVEQWEGDRLPYVDNLVNLFVVSGECEVAREEMLRTLAPGGVALFANRQSKIENRKFVKPRPKEIDSWPHALYDASNNAVAHDQVVGPPYHLQWVGLPRNARHHGRLSSVSVVVSAGGRIFTIIDEAPTGSILLRPQWALVARDAFNGVVLWKRRIRSWEPYLRSFRSGPPALMRRLVAAKDKVYVTLDIRAPITALNPATGETRRTYEGTAGTEEILWEKGTLYAVVDEHAGSAGRKATRPAPGGKSIMAIDGATGKLLWKKSGVAPMPTTLAVAVGRVFYQTAEAIFCLDSKTGEEIWRHERPCAAKRPGWSSPTLVVSDHPDGAVVLCADRRADLAPGKGKKRAWNAAYGAGGPGELVALDAGTGKTLWTCPCNETFHAPVDVFVINGLVWVGESRLRKDADFTQGRDLRTGEVKKKLSTAKAFKTTMAHHRCHRNRATDRYILCGRTGVEFIGLNTGEALRHHWVRGACQYGFIPANGLLYAPPHSCACYIEAKLTGFLALAPKDQKSEAKGQRSERLEKGPAYSTIPQSEIRNPKSEDWPTYRHDPARSGSTKTSVPADLKLAWQFKPGGKLSSPVIAEGKVFVASVDAHTVHALDAGSGAKAWSYTAGGRVDSPPTVSQGRVVFGSADGWVYCLRASDGKLAWRFRAAPEERRALAFQQVESVWPVHGSVLVRGNVVFCAAGRSSYLDNGIYVYRLDLATGKKLSEKRLYSRDPVTGEQPEEPQWFDMPGAFPDVLSSDGDLLYMRQMAFDPDSLEERESRSHIFSPAGFLNGEWWHRTYWIYGTHFYSGYIGWYFAGREVPAGRLLVTDGPSIYGFAYQPSLYGHATGRKYHLFSLDKKAHPPQPPRDYKWAQREYPHRGKRKFKLNFQWSKDVPLLAKAMVLTDKTLFVAGPPVRALRSRSAFEGRRGGRLCAVSASNGETLREYHLDSLPVHDGLAAANGRLFMSTKDGRLLCMGKEGQPIAEAVGPGKKAGAGAPTEPGLVGYWKLDEGQGEDTADSSGLGNDAEVYGQWAKGKFGTCLFTNGAPGALTICDGSYLHFGASDFSIEFWVTVDEFGKRFMGKSSFPKAWWVINLLSDGRPEMVLGESTAKGKSVRPASKTPLVKGKWTHIAFTVDRKNAVVKCYMNGKLDRTTKIPPTLTGSLSIEGKDLRIPENPPFVGLFDELKLYNRVLTDAEIAQSYDKEKGNRASVEFEYAGP